MSKNKIPAERFTPIIQNSGLMVEEKSGFIKVFSGAGAVYVAKGKTVARVDVSGFTLPSGPGVLDLGDKSFGKVRQQLDFSMAEDSILSTFEQTLKTLVALPVIPKKEMAKPYRDPSISPRRASKKTETEQLTYGCQTRQEAYAHRIPDLKAAYQRMLQRRASQMLMAEQPTDLSAECGPVLSDEAMDFLFPTAPAKELMA